MSLVVSRHIAVPRETVWAVIAGPSALGSANLGIARVDGQIETGRTVLVSFSDEPRYPYPIRIDVADAPREMMVRFHLPLGMLKGSAAMRLMSCDSGTEIEVSIGFSGWLGNGAHERLETLRPYIERFLHSLETAVAGDLEEQLQRISGDPAG